MILKEKKNNLVLKEIFEKCQSILCIFLFLEKKLHFLAAKGLTHFFCHAP